MSGRCNLGLVTRCCVAALSAALFTRAQPTEMGHLQTNDITLAQPSNQPSYPVRSIPGPFRKHVGRRGHEGPQGELELLSAQLSVFRDHDVLQHARAKPRPPRQRLSARHHLASRRQHSPHPAQLPVMSGAHTKLIGARPFARPPGTLRARSAVEPPLVTCATVTG